MRHKKRGHLPCPRPWVFGLTRLYRQFRSPHKWTSALFRIIVYLWPNFKDVLRISKCFSCLQLSLSKASAKVRRIFHTAKKIFPHVREKVYLCSAFGTDVARTKQYIYIVLGLLAVGLGALGVVTEALLRRTYHVPCHRLQRL